MRLTVGPFNRVEGDLEVTLDIADGRVAAAWVNSPLYRGFEQILRGKSPTDALVFVPRICGICSVSQSSAAAAALADAMGVTPPPNGVLANNLILANENLADHFTHFYLFFMPDFARETYAGRPWFDAVAARFRALTGTAAAAALPARAAFLQIMGVLAGKWPHTLSLQPGGSSRPLRAAEPIRVYSLLRQFRAWLEKHLFGDALEAVAALGSVEQLLAWRDARPATHSDFRLFLAVADDLALHRLGRATDRFLAYGNYPAPAGGGRLFTAGVWDGAPHALDPAAISEDVSHAWIAAGADVAGHPARSTTLPDADKPGAYSWCKAPRWHGRVAEVGALARQTVHGHALARDLVARDGGNVASRVICRLLELALVVPAMERWVRELAPGEPYHVAAQMPDSAEGAGLVESARGALGHWLRVRHGRIDEYQIVAPTTWNFSPRDAAGTPGALEQALVGTPVAADERVPVAVQHVVRSFDPCMVCTVH